MEGKRGEMHDSEADEALSLRDLPISSESVESPPEERRYSTSLADLDGFEFAKGATRELCAAEDVFSSSGEIIPWRTSIAEDRASSKSRQKEFRSKSSNLDPLVRMTSGSRIERRDQHGGHRKLERASRSGSCEARFPPSRLRWCLFGLVKAPEIELKDLRFRQNRRIQTGRYAECAVEDWGRMRKGDREMTEDAKVQWKLIRALSCNGKDSTVVSPSLVCMPHV